MSDLLKVYSCLFYGCRRWLLDVLRTNLPPKGLLESALEHEGEIKPLLGTVPNYSLYNHDFKKIGAYEVYVLIRTVSTLSMPEGGWNKTPESLDRSVSANVERIGSIMREFRQEKNPPESRLHTMLVKLRTISKDLGKELDWNVGYMGHMDIHTRGIYKQLNWFPDSDTVTEENTDEIRELMKKHKETGIPLEILRMDSKAVNLYKTALSKGQEEDNSTKVMVVGHGGVGKTTLTRRLLKLPVDIKEYQCTNGVEVHTHKCSIDIKTGMWEFNPKKKQKLKYLKKVFRMKKKKKKEIPKADTETSYRRRCARAFKSVFEEKELEKAENKSTESLEQKLLELQKKYQKDNEGSDSPDDEVFENVPLQEVKTDAKTGSMKKSAPQSNPTYRIHNISDVKEPDLESVITELEKMNKEGKTETKAYVTFYDFAGQYVFYSSHLTFMSPKAIYLLVMDLRKLMSDLIEDDEFFGDIYGATKRNAMDYLVHWLNVVYSYAIARGDPLPQVVLVTTHADKVPGQKGKKAAQDAFKEIRLLLANTPQIQLLSENEFVVDNTLKESPAFDEIRQEIFRLSKNQPTWGQLIPTRWLPLEEELSLLKADGQKVMSTEEVRSINSQLAVQVDDEEEMNLFLQYLHDSGEVIFFNDDDLKGSIILDPVWLIDVLKCIITSERFALTHPKIIKEWKYFAVTGAITRRTIETLWSGAENTSLHSNHEHLIALLEKLQFIASPDQSTNAKKDKEDEIFVVPCMIKGKPNLKLLEPDQLGGFRSTSTLSLVSKDNFLPTAAFHKLLAVCINKWPIVEERGEKMIFSGYCRFTLDVAKTMHLTLYLVEHVLHTFITSYSTAEELFPETCRSVRTFLVETFKMVLKTMGLTFRIAECIKCPLVKPTLIQGYVDVAVLEKHGEFRCAEHDPPHMLQKNALLDYWIEPCGMQSSQSVQSASASMKSSIRNPGSSRAISGNHVNYARLCNVILTLCADALRKILALKFPIPFRDIHSAIANNETKLTGGRKPLLNSEQKQLLFPTPPATSSATEEDFDISLLYLLIRNISTVRPPQSTKWGVKPHDQPRDISLGASVERVRLFRNQIAGHSISAEITDADFQTNWDEIKCCMGDIEKEIGNYGFQTAMDVLRDENMNFLSVKQIGFKFHQEMMANIQEIKSEVADGNALYRTEYEELKRMLTEMKSSIEELKSHQSRKTTTFELQATHFSTDM